MGMLKFAVSLHLSGELSPGVISQDTRRHWRSGYFGVLTSMTTRHLQCVRSDQS